ncbi:Reverse transcriptase domain [Cinara cedri]|uniref:Reverse transcriptase domain n=1 Tax=Cinara cedri TaxID=506608 RepID=A0A5E4NF21_9HEMI|nr:Reverse transcriptase domain [Cinara cedri]
MKTSNRVKVNNEIPSSFIINSGLKQSNAMSPVLFNMALTSIIKKLLQTETLNHEEGNFLLVYANDIVIIGKSQEGIQSTVKELIKIEKDIDQTNHSGKTKYRMVKQGGVIIITFVRNNIFEQVHEFKYLGDQYQIGCCYQCL